LVFDSPHSGSAYPDDFDYVLDRVLLRQSEDAHIDALFVHVTDQGAPLLHAEFPRCYIDPNRALADFDVTLVEGDWPHPVAPGDKTGRGMGLVWRRMRSAGDIYDRRLSVAEVQRRIDVCWKPYHAALSSLIDETHERFGQVWHIDCHSMPAMGDETTADGPVARPDFILGDRDGTTCDSELTAFAQSILEGLGYDVTLNFPYAGVELVRAYSAPAEQRHSLQLEINRKLYMNETTFERSEGFEALRQDLVSFTRALADEFARRAA
ncbi:MAG: N-formylglutamate amidohydrolase, partial [Methyloligellaceae bacterium]